MCFNGAATQEGKTQHDAQNSSHCDNALFVAVDRVRGAAHAVGRGDLARARKSPCSCPKARRIRPRHASILSMLTAGGERANPRPSWAFLRALGQPTPKASTYHQSAISAYPFVRFFLIAAINIALLLAWICCGLLSRYTARRAVFADKWHLTTCWKVRFITNDLQSTD